MRHCAGARSDQRGSAVVLVLVSVVLMAILAATLLQVTRFERIPKTRSGIDAAVESVIAEIVNQITKDLLDDNGNLFNSANVGGGGDEPYDFPWTSRFYSGRMADLSDGSSVQVYGGWMDDAWLAWGEPDFRNSVPANSSSDPSVIDSTSGVWRKITCLQGMYLGGTSGSSDLSTVGSPNEYPVTFTDQLHRDSDLPIAGNTSLVDADGDGIGDSRWEWCPLKQIGNTQYVMAVRIVDLSARMNVNVATGSTIDMTLFGRGLPRGNMPSEVDGSGFITILSNTANSGVNQTTALDEWRNVLGFRLTGNVASSIANVPGYMSYDADSAPSGAGTRLDYWLKGASLIGNDLSPHGNPNPGGGFDYGPDSTFKIEDAFELLYRNGLNSATTTTLENVMPTLLRSGGEENNFVINNPLPANNGENWSAQQFFKLDARKHLTTVSGLSAIAPPWAPNKVGQMQMDINAVTASNNYTTNLKNYILALLQDPSTNGNALLARYPQFSSLDRLANQIAVSLVDYADEDNYVSTLSPQYGQVQAGFEALPFISEVYTQRYYEVQSVNPKPSDSTKDIVVWTQKGDQGIVIEIGNPFARFDSGWKGHAVKLTDIWLNYEIGDTGGTPIKLSSIAGVPNKLDPGEVLLLTINSTGNTDDATLDDLSNYQPAPGNFTTVHTATAPSLPANATSLNIRLHCRPQNNTNPMDGSYNTCKITLPGNTITEEVAAGKIPVAQVGIAKSYVQTNYQGVGQGLRMMTVASGTQSSGVANGYGDEVTTLTTPSDNCDTLGGTYAATRTFTPALANEAKPNEPTTYGSLDGADQQFAIGNSPHSRMNWIGDLLNVPLISPVVSIWDPYSPMYKSFEDANASGLIDTYGVEAMLLPYRKNADNSIPVVDNNANASALGDTFGLYNYPHGLMLMEALTTFNPAMDGQNGDANPSTPNDSVTSPDDGELLVSGKINLNTATFEDLVRTLPYSDLNTRIAIADAIVTRRESLTQFSDNGVGADNTPAIQYVSALYEQLEGLSVNPSQMAGNTVLVGGIRADLNDYEELVGTTINAPTFEDMAVDDRDEEIMLAKWLNQVAGCRSDVFAAYILVQGYEADNFSSGPVESKQLIVIFSRSGVYESGDKATVIDRLYYPE